MARDFDVSIRLLSLYDFFKNEGEISSQKEFCSKIGISQSFFTEIKKALKSIRASKMLVCKRANDGS
jgi:hypothetical protein